MDASPRIVGLTVTTADDEQGGPVSGLFAGSATGPVRALEAVRAAGPGRPVPRTVQAEGERLFVGESASGRITVRGLAEPARRVALPAGAQSPTFAGDLVAYAEEPHRPPGARRGTDLEALLPHRVVVREWRTGRRRTAFSVPGGVAGLAVSRSGALAVGEARGGVLELRPGRSLRRIARSQPAPWPGATPVYEPGGRMRAFGVASLRIGALAADERRVLWGAGAFADGCVTIADVRARAAQAIAAGPAPERRSISS
jgi:hypothetical protein